MAENTKIEWATHTMNPWRGCTKVSAGCKHCYADTLSKRNPTVLGIWGPNGTRVVASEPQWRLPVKWNREAKKLDDRPRVFCASLADVFEEWSTMPDSSHDAIMKARKRLGELIVDTTELDWLLLTKRPQNVMHVARDMWRFAHLQPNGALPSNVWIGTSVEDQEAADKRIPLLSSIPAKVRFLSVEPLLGPLDLTGHLASVHWVIVGGESGPDSRPMNPEWVRSIRDQCIAAKVCFFFKQYGDFAPTYTPDPLNDISFNGHWVRRVGKKAAGRLLDGREWNEIPGVVLRKCKECGIKRPASEMACMACAGRKTAK